MDPNPVGARAEGSQVIETARTEGGTMARNDNPDRTNKTAKAPPRNFGRGLPRNGAPSAVPRHIDHKR